MAWNQTNPYAVYLGLIRLTVDDDRLARCLMPLGEAIKECERAIDSLTAGDDEGYVDAVVDEETAVIEHLIGTAFVVCQAYITAVVSRIIGLHQFHNRRDPKNLLKTTGATKGEILRFGGTTIGVAPYTAPEIINAFANYFKHRDEWRVAWEKLPNRDRPTAKIISAAGAERGSSGNFRTAAELLMGRENYSDTLKLSEFLDVWGKALESNYSAELASRGLIKMPRRRRAD